MLILTSICHFPPRAFNYPLVLQLSVGPFNYPLVPTNTIRWSLPALV
jgi:hypothetical protein